MITGNIILVMVAIAFALVYLMGRCGGRTSGYKLGHKDGFYEGVEEGRMQILREDIMRIEAQRKRLSSEIATITYQGKGMKHV